MDKFVEHTCSLTTKPVIKRGFIKHLGSWKYRGKTWRGVQQHDSRQHHEHFEDQVRLNRQTAKEDRKANHAALIEAKREEIASFDGKDRDQTDPAG